MHMLPRPRRFFAAVRSLALAGLLTAGTSLPGVAGAADLTVVSWGGAYTKSQILGYIRPFQDESGLDVEVVNYDGGLEEIRSQVRSYNVKWDVVDLEREDALRACREGLLEKIDPGMIPASPEGVPPREDFMPGSLTECGVGSVLWSTVLAYDPAAFPDEEPPERMEALFDLDKFPGKRGLRKSPKGNLEWALIADGVAPERVYEVLETDEGLDRAFRMLSRIKPHIIWWQAGSEAIHMLESDQLRMTAVYSGRVWEANTQRNADLAMIWDHQTYDWDLWGIVRHTSHLERAKAFLRFAGSTRSLAQQASHVPNAPVRRSSQERVPEAMRPYLPTAKDHMETALQIDAEWWAEHYERINARFEQWLERPVQVPRFLPH